MNPSNLCPVCGFELDFNPHGRTIKTEKLCICCGINFGHDDKTGEDDPEAAYMKWRAWWILQGMRWWSTSPIPPNFDPDKQLARLDQAGPK